MNKLFNNNIVKSQNHVLKIINNNSNNNISRYFSYGSSRSLFIKNPNNNEKIIQSLSPSSLISTSSKSNKILFNGLINESINKRYINRYYSTDKPQQSQPDQPQTENNNNNNNSNSNNNSNNNNNNNNNNNYSNNSNSNSNNKNNNENEYNKYKEETKKKLNEKNKTTAMYVAITIVMVLGASYAAVPLYRVFCRVTGFGGTVREADEFDIARVRDLNRNVYPFKVTFTASTANKIPWSFKPTQPTIECIPGEPVLCFYRATNNTDTPIIGVATYNITPMKAGSYFTKIQCFCFDEQRINAHETIDMPVLFVIEPEILDDKNMKGVTDITLSYTFFKSNDQGELEEI